MVQLSSIQKQKKKERSLLKLHILSSVAILENLEIQKCLPNLLQQKKNNIIISPKHGVH